jgi:hypothetical protein
MPSRGVYYVIEEKIIEAIPVNTANRISLCYQ